jgi:hypothetical protein
MSRLWRGAVFQLVDQGGSLRADDVQIGDVKERREIVAVLTGLR